MPSKARTLVLTVSQAASLAALRQHKAAKTGIAIHARLDLKETATGLDRLEELGLAVRDESRRWKTTQRGRTCRFKIVPDRKRRHPSRVGRGARRLLDLLDRPRRARDLAEELGLTNARINQLLVKLHAQGRIKFADDGGMARVVARRNDKTPLLPRTEERVLSVMPADYVTNVTKIRLAAGLSEKQTRRIIERLLAGGFIEACDGLSGDPAYRITAAGLKHPQYSQRSRLAPPPRLPVESDRILAVLSALLDRGSMRIHETRDALAIPHDSIRALMQYLKRKTLVRKTEQTLLAPYELTDKGHETLTEMLRRRAA